MPITLDGTNGITTPSYGGTDTSEYLVPVTGFKNRIINGAMMVSQRSGTATQTINNTTAYSLDRWAVNFTGGSGTVQQVTGTGGFKYAMRLTGGSGITFGFISQKIESYNIYDCASSTVTYKIRASSSTLTTLNWNARFPTTQDNYAGVTAISNGSITINSTPTDYTFQIALPAGVTNGFEVYFDFGSFTSGTLDITGVQLEKGSTATSFDYRPYGTELALCQRYYQLTNNYSGVGSATTNSVGMLSYSTMRALPTLGLQGVYVLTDGISLDYTQSSASIAYNVANAGTVNGAYAFLGNFTSVTNGKVMFSRFSNSNQITLSAEL